jgi:erythromycin esterase
MKIVRRALLMSAMAAAALAQTGPRNLDFREGAVGEEPAGWNHQPQYEARVLDTGCQKPDARCVSIEAKGNDLPPFGSFSQFVAPGDLRNQRVKFSAWVRVTEVPGCKAQLWFRTDLPDNAAGFFYNMNDRPITSPEWKPYEFVAQVQPEAVKVNFGLILLGACKVYAGDFKLEPQGILETPFVDPKLRTEDAPKVEWLKKNAIPIRTIDPADDDFADLQPLKKIIGDARVVQLGEQSHGDGATFYAKERLIRFLHEQMGFDVLAWESGFYDCEEMNQAIDSDMPALEAAQKGVFGIWTRGGLMTPLFEYARSTLKTARPLRQTGFDIQFSGSNQQGFAKVLDDLGDGIASDADKQTVRDTVRAMARTPGYKPSKEEEMAAQAAATRIAEALRKSAGSARDPRRAQFLAKSFEDFGALVHLRTQTLPSQGIRADFSFRDIKMGENLIWLANDWYKGKKIIVWAASMHVTRNAAAIDTRMDTLNYKDYRTMGQVVHESLGKAAYTITFTAYRGKSANPSTSQRPLMPPAAESVETLFHAAGMPYALVDFRGLPEGHWLRTPMIMRPLGYAQMKSDWTTNFDAVLFTDVMFPNTPAGTVPAGVKTKK